MARAQGFSKVYSKMDGGTMYFWHTTRGRSDANTLFALSSAGVVLGVSGSGADFTWYGDTAGDFILFDESEDRAEFEDIALRVMDDTPLQLGDSADYSIHYDLANTRLEILPLVANGAIWFGDGVTNPDIRIAGADTTNNIYMDASENQLRLTGVSIEMQTTGKIQLRDTGIYIQSSVDAQLDLVSDGDIYLNGKVERKVNTEILSANKTLVVGDADWQFLDPGGAARTVYLPVTGLYVNKGFVIVNTADAAESIGVMMSGGGTTVCTIAQNETGKLRCNGVFWSRDVGAAT